MKLLLIDDHPLFLDGFSAKLAVVRPHWQLLCASSSAEGQAAFALDPTIDMVLIDLQLPDLDGFDTLARIALLNPVVPRVVISGREDSAAIQRARHAGASGFISKSTLPTVMIDVLEAIADGHSGFAHLAEAAPTVAPALTGRQIEVLNLLNKGCTNKEMRYRLGIAERTIRGHLTEVFQALGVHSRVQAILSARAAGLIP
jgi:DNA-binding NarL/FixJ family response regulator